jgi:hypothetical protein
LQVVPVELAALRPDGSIGLIGCLIGGGAILGYQMSSMDILGRYTTRRSLRISAAACLAVSPIVGYVLLKYQNSTFWWSITNLILLSCLSGWCFFKSTGESRRGDTVTMISTRRHEGSTGSQ